MPFFYQEHILQKQVERVLRAHDLFSPQRTLLAACSGGTDSLALLYVLDLLRSAGGARLICVHYEHGIRGTDSLADACFVERFCTVRKIPFILGTGDVPAYARTHRLSIETAARICRYDFFHRIRDERGCDAVVLAHHADDLAETILLRILRGTGPAGLAAMQEWDGLHLRPFLTVTRAAIETYADECGLKPRYDATNDCMDVRRNRIRHELLPELARVYNPAVQEALTRLGTLAGEEDDFLAGVAAETFQHAMCPEGLSVVAVRAMHPAMQRRVLRLFWAQKTGTTQDFSYLHEERMRALLAAKGARVCEMPHGWQARVRYGVLTLHHAPSVKPIVEKGEILLPFIREYAIMNFRGIEFRFRRLTHMTADDWHRMKAREAVYADLDGLPPLVLRTRRTGDYIRLPFGRKKLKNILIDDKIPQEQRDVLPLIALADTHEIFWIAGGRRSIIAPVTESSTDVLDITCVKETIDG